MNSTSTKPTPSANAAATLGLILVRCIVPLWITAGAVTKLQERSPKLLPEHLRELIESAGMDLHVALSIFLSIEFAAVAVMVLIPRLSRMTAVLMLGVFCVVLLYEMFNGNVTSCGCLGSVSPPPWLMLSIDAFLLVLVAALPVRPLKLASDRVAWGLATVLAVALGIISFGRVLGGAQGVQVVVHPEGTHDSGASTAASSELSLPAYYSLDVSDWAGRKASEVDLISWVQHLPDSIHTGQQYLIFYSRTCEHCYELLLEHFSYDPPAPTILVAIPESVDGFIVDGAMENPCADCNEFELPVGVDWLRTPPVVVALENGVIICAKEAEDMLMPECLPWHGY